MSSIIRLLLCISVLVLLVSCSSKPVRHLASDASMVKTGTSTKEDVLAFLGDPDAQQMVSETSERWIYYEETQSSLQKMPYVGGFFNSTGYSRIVVTFEDDIAVDCTYSSYDTEDYDWSDDYSWQEKRQ